MSTPYTDVELTYLAYKAAIKLFPNEPNTPRVWQIADIIRPFLIEAKVGKHEA